VVGNKNTQNAEVLLDLHPNQSQHEQSFQDQQDASKKVQNKTSKYTGVSWKKDKKKWQAQLKHKGNNYFGGYFDDEEETAMSVNLLCDKYGIERKHPMINIDLGAIQKVKNQTSIYTGVTWHNNSKKWQVRLVHNKKNYFGGYFDNEEHAGMKVNFLCDKYGMEHKNPMILIDPDKIHKVPNKTSIYNGVSWNKGRKKWYAQFIHQAKTYYGGLFDHEEDAAMKINLICDEIEVERKNPEINADVMQKKTKFKIYQYATENIMNETVKIEDENILDGFKDVCENHFIHQSNDEERCIVNAKRKRKQNSMINQDVKEEEKRK